MLYRTNPKNNDRLSQLGFGCMRFAKDDQEVEKQIVHAIEQGVNYFDTAYIYPNSEERLGQVLAKGYRDKVFIATKLPTFMAKKYEYFDRMLDTQLKRLQTDHIDYYFMHIDTHTQTKRERTDCQRSYALSIFIQGRVTMYYVLPVTTIDEIITFIIQCHEMPPMLLVTEDECRKIKKSITIALASEDYNKLSISIDGIVWDLFANAEIWDFLADMLGGFCASAKAMLNIEIEM